MPSASASRPSRLIRSSNGALFRGKPWPAGRLLPARAPAPRTRTPSAEQPSAVVAEPHGPREHQAEPPRARTDEACHRADGHDAHPLRPKHDAPKPRASHLNATHAPHPQPQARAHPARPHRRERARHRPEQAAPTQGQASHHPDQLRPRATIRTLGDPPTSSSRLRIPTPPLGCPASRGATGTA